MFRQRIRFVLRLSFIGALCLLLLSCQLSGYIWIVPGSEVNNLVFGISGERSKDIKGKVHSITVYRCADIYNRGSDGYYPPIAKAVWVANTPYQKESPYTNRIVYGQSQENLETIQGAQPLDVPGCYTVMSYVDYGGDIRGATVGFKVNEDGSVAQMSDDESSRLFSRSR